MESSKKRASKKKNKKNMKKNTPLGLPSLASWEFYMFNLISLPKKPLKCFVCRHGEYFFFASAMMRLVGEFLCTISMLWWHNLWIQTWHHLVAHALEHHDYKSGHSEVTWGPMFLLHLIFRCWLSWLTKVIMKREVQISRKLVIFYI